MSKRADIKNIHSLEVIFQPLYEDGSRSRAAMYVDLNPMIVKGNHRLSEAEAFAAKYVQAFQDHLQLPEGFTLKKERQKNTEPGEGGFNIASYDLYFEREDSGSLKHKKAIFEAIEKAHEKAVAEIGAPKVHMLTDETVRSAVSRLAARSRGPSGVGR